MRIVKAVEDIIIVDVHCLVGTKHENLKGHVKILRTHSVDLDDAIVDRCLRNELGGNFVRGFVCRGIDERSEEHTSELQSLMRISYAVFCLKKKITNIYN